MSKNLEIKKQVVSDIVKKFQDAKSVIVVSFSGLSVENVTALRAQFRANGVDYCVLKNTLVRRALQELNIEEWKNGERFTVIPSGEFELSWCLEEIPEEYLEIKQIRFTKKKLWKQ